MLALRVTSGDVSQHSHISAQGVTCLHACAAVSRTRTRFDRVKMARDTTDGSFVAVKLIDLGALSSRGREHLQREIKVGISLATYF